MAQSRRIFLEQALLALGAVAAHPLTKAIGAEGQPERGWKFYEAGGQITFPVYGAAGGLCAAHVCYLIRGRSVIAVQFKDLEFMAIGDNEEAVRRLVALKIRRAVERGNWQHVDWNGGALPKPEEI